MKPSRLLAAAATVAAVSLPTTFAPGALAAGPPGQQRVCQFFDEQRFSSTPEAVTVAEAMNGSSELVIADGAVDANRYTGKVSVRIGQLAHTVTYERWNLVLRAPGTGREAVLMSGAKIEQAGAIKNLSHVEFTDDPSAPAIESVADQLDDARTAANPLRVRAAGTGGDSISALMGATPAGKWELLIEDVFGTRDPRRAPRAPGDVVGTFDGDWAIGIQPTDCKSQPPYANFEMKKGYKVGIVGQQVEFTAETSTDPDKAADADQALEYSWSTVQTTDPAGPPAGSYGPWGTTATFSHAFDAPGSYTVWLRVRDASGEVSTIGIPYRITDAPVPVIKPSTETPAVGQTVVFDGSASSDANGIVEYRWSIGNVVQLGPTFSTSFANSGAVTVGLRVTDADGATASTSVTLTVGGSGGAGGGDTGGGGGGGGTLPVQQPGPVNPGTPPVVVDPTPGTDATVLPDEGFGGATPPAEAVAVDGFTAAISAAAKQKSAKAAKKGIAVKFTLNAPGDVTVRLMAAPKDAKKAGLKLKGKKAVAIATGKLEITKAGSKKLTLKVKKKYKSLFTKLKKKKKLKLVVRAVAASADSGSELAVAKALTVTR